MLICYFPETGNDQLSVAHSFTTHKKKLHTQNQEEEEEGKKAL